MVPILCSVLFLVTGWFRVCTLGSLTGWFFVGTLGALPWGCCCVFFLPGFTFATVTVWLSASWRALRVTFEVCDSRKGNGDFSERMLVRSWTASTKRSLALICGNGAVMGEELNCICCSGWLCSGNIHCIIPVMFQSRADIKTICSMVPPTWSFSRSLMNNSFATSWC